VRTAIDTNVISALWSNEPSSSEIAGRLGSAKGDGGLVIAAPVYAELLAYPKATEAFVHGFLADTGITIDFDLNQAAWLEAGRRFAKYANRRRQISGEHPRRLLVDFIIGSHTLLQADRLMTLDASRYRRDFPEIKLV